jgi:hypothetical protein
VIGIHAPSPHALLMLLRSGFSLNISWGIPGLFRRMTRAFFQAINNFALGPLSFVGAYKSLGRNSRFDSLCVRGDEIAVFDFESRPLSSPSI